MCNLWWLWLSLCGLSGLLGLCMGIGMGCGKASDYESEIWLLKQRLRNAGIEDLQD